MAGLLRLLLRLKDWWREWRTRDRQLKGERYRRSANAERWDEKNRQR